MIGRPESHHTLQVVALFMEFNHVQSLELKSEHSGNKTKSTLSMREITSKSAGCSIQDEDVTLLCDMLKVNTSLTKLNLSSYRHRRTESQMDCFLHLQVTENMIGDVGAVMLSGALKVNSALIALTLEG